MLGEIRSIEHPFAVNLEKLIDATPDGRKLTATTRESMNAARDQCAARQAEAAQRG